MNMIEKILFKLFDQIDALIKGNKKKRAIIIGGVIGGVVILGACLLSLGEQNKKEIAEATTVSDTEIIPQVIEKEDPVAYLREENKGETSEEVVETSMKYTGVEKVEQYGDIHLIKWLTDDRILIQYEDELNLYDADFNEIISLSNVELDDARNGFVLHSRDFFHDGSFRPSYGIIDQEGTSIIEPSSETNNYEAKELFSDLVSDDEHEVYVEIIYGEQLDTVGLRVGDQILDPIYQSIEPHNFKNKQYAFKDQNGKWGVITLDGEIILEPTFNSVTYTENYGKGNEVIFITYNELGEQGLFIPTEALTIAPQFSHEDEIRFLGDYFTISNDNKKTFVYNLEGEVVKELLKPYQLELVNQYYVSKDENRLTIFNEEFDVLMTTNIDCQETEVNILDNELVIIMDNSNYTFLNFDGTLIKKIIPNQMMRSCDFFHIFKDNETFMIDDTIYRLISSHL